MYPCSLIGAELTRDSSTATILPGGTTSVSGFEEILQIFLMCDGDGQMAWPNVCPVRMGVCVKNVPTNRRKRLPRLMSKKAGSNETPKSCCTKLA